MSAFDSSEQSKSRSSQPVRQPLVGVDVPRVDFQIVGAMKCGTTTLRRALTAHPDVYLPPGEQHFFGNHRRYLSAWQDGVLDAERFEEVYAAQFRSQARVVGGKTPSYIMSMVSLERMQRFHPDTKVIVILRCPIDRAQSHWNHLVRRRARGQGPATLVGESFEAHIERDVAELDRARDPAVEMRGTNIVWRGMYAPQLHNVRRFFPEERTFVGVLEDLKSAPETFLQRLCTFLDIEYMPELVRAAADSGSRAPGHTEQLTSDARTRLREVYADSVHALEQMLGRDLRGWLR